jgi:hypothetical protein
LHYETLACAPQKAYSSFAPYLGLSGTGMDVVKLDEWILRRARIPAWNGLNHIWPKLSLTVESLEKYQTPRKAVVLLGCLPETLC